MPTIAPIEFIVTDAGMAAATLAYDTGIRVTLTTFALGSGYGYTPTTAMTSLQGSHMYSDTITSYRNLPDGTEVLELTVSDEAGTFQFGEVGIFTDTGVLFALAAFPTMQTKYSSLGTGVTSTFTFNAHLRLAQATAIFNVVAYMAPNTVYGPWSAALPYSMMSTSATDYMVTDLDSKNDGAWLTQKSEGGILKWSIQSNYFYLRGSPTIAAAASDGTWIEISQADWASLVIVDPSAGTMADWMTYANHFTFVIESASNYFRQSSGLTISGSNIRFSFVDAWGSGQIAAGEHIKTWVNDSDLMQKHALASEIDRAETVEIVLTTRYPGSAQTVHGYLPADATTMTMTASEVVMISGVNGGAYKVSALNCSLNTGITGAGGMDTGLAPVDGFVAIYAIYRPDSGGIVSLLAQDCTSYVAPFIYSGAHMPASYVASWLISVWPTNTYRQLQAMEQWDKRLTYLGHGSNGVHLFDVHNDVYAGVGGAVSCYWAMPKNAVRATGMMTLSTSDGGSTAYGFGLQTTVSGAGCGYEGYAAFYVQGPWDLQISYYSQTLFYGVGVGSHPVDTSYHLSSYEFGGPNNFYPFGSLSV